MANKLCAYPSVSKGPVNEICNDPCRMSSSPSIWNYRFSLAKLSIFGMIWFGRRFKNVLLLIFSSMKNCTIKTLWSMHQITLALYWEWVNICSCFEKVSSTKHRISIKLCFFRKNAWHSTLNLLSEMLFWIFSCKPISHCSEEYFFYPKFQIQIFIRNLKLLLRVEYFTCYLVIRFAFWNWA